MQSGNQDLPSKPVSAATCIHAMCIVNQNVFFCNSILTQFHHFQSEAFLHQSEFLVLAKQHRFAMFQINRILGAAFLIVYRFVCTVIEYHAILKNLANRSTLMVSGCLQHFHSAGTVRCHSTGKETSACTKA